MRRTTRIAWFSRVFILGIGLTGINVSNPLPETAAPKSLTELQNQLLIQQGEIDSLQAQIDTLKASVTDLGVRRLNTRASNFLVPQGAPVLVPLDGLGVTRTNSFNLAGDLTVTYTARCAVDAPDLVINSWLNIDIELVNLDDSPESVTVLAPSNSVSDVFCASNGLASPDEMAMTSITGVATGLPRANYAVQIRANIEGNIGTGWLGYSSLVVRK